MTSAKDITDPERELLVAMAKRADARVTRYGTDSHAMALSLEKKGLLKVVTVGPGSYTWTPLSPV